SLPQLSRLSVKGGPADRFRHWCSFRYLRILPLHRKFHLPLPPSSPEVSNGLSQLSQELSHSTFRTACARFTPSKSGQRSQPTYYRGCWHVVSRSPLASPLAGKHPFDLHVLCTPPAFVLSQNQTLRQKNQTNLSAGLFIFEFESRNR